MLWPAGCDWWLFYCCYTLTYKVYKKLWIYCIFSPHIPLILVMSQYQFLLHVSHMYLINCRYGGVHWLVWCVRDNWLPSMGCSATSVSRGYGQCGASQEKDQILLHEPLWEVPRSRTKTLETPPADHQNCHYYHPGSILRHDLNSC